MNIELDKLPLPKEPYRGILPFRLLDWSIFLERDRETQHLVDLISIYRGVLLYGQSGAGKSSLLNAGLVPHALRQGRAPERIRLFPVRGREIQVERVPLWEAVANGAEDRAIPRYLPSRFTTMDSDERAVFASEDFLKKLEEPSDLGKPLLIFDQFEELVTLFEENPKDKDRVQTAKKARWAIRKLLLRLLLHDKLPVKIVFAFRDDYLARLTPFFARIPHLLDQRVLLMPPRVHRVKQIVRGPFVKSQDGRRGLPGHFRNELSEELADTIAAGLSARRPSGVLNLSEVQTLCLALWKQPKRREELLRAPKPAAVLQKIIESEAVATLKNLRPLDKIRALVLLSNLVTTDGTRDVVGEENLIEETRRSPVGRILRGDLMTLLNTLVEPMGLLRRSSSSGDSSSSGNKYYELTSEFLIPLLQKQQQRLRRLARAISAYVIAGLLGLLVLVGYLAYRADSERQGAEEAQSRAEEEGRRVIKALKDAKAAKEKTTEALKDTKAAKEKVEAALKEVTEAKAEVEKAKTKAENSEKAAVTEREYAYRLMLIIRYPLGESLRNAVPLSIRKKINAKIREYIEGHPPEAGDSGAVREKASALVQYGEILFEEGKPGVAHQQYNEAVKLLKGLLKQKPENTDYQRDLSVCYENIGDVLSEQPNLTGLTDAYKNYWESLVLREGLIKRDPGNVDWQRDLSVSYEKVGNVRSAWGDLWCALENYGDSLVMREVSFTLRLVRESLGTQDPGNVESLRDLSVSHTKIGNVLSDLGVLSDVRDFSGALTHYSASLGIAEALARLDPLNTEWQRDLSVSYNNLGDAQLAEAEPTQGDPSEALTNYRASLEIRDKLARSDPGNPNWQADLSASYQRIERGRDILLQMKKSTRLTPEQVILLGKITEDLRKMKPRPR